MAISGRTIAALARPFDGGDGPSHTSIERVFAAEDASDYLPDEGSKASRVLAGLRALRSGQRAGSGRPALSANPDKLRRVSSALADDLVAGNYVAESDVADALDDAPDVADRQKASPRAVDPGSEPAGSTASPQSSRDQVPSQIFVVHGHQRKDAVARFIARVTGSEPVVLGERAGMGRTIIEKFEDESRDTGYAIVLLTADDEGRRAGEGDLRARARQNAVLELGYFVGRLGRGRVAVLYEDGVELPSDLAGVEYLPLDGDWQLRLVRELIAAGVEVDARRI